MEIKPVGQVESPAYPTRDELLGDEKTLQDCLPRRWRKAKGLAGALALLLAANVTGCGDGADNRPAAAPEDRDNPVVVESSYWIRSIFRGRQVMLGCIAMMPPAVLQEDAAKHAVENAVPLPAIPR